MATLSGVYIIKNQLEFSGQLYVLNRFAEVISSSVQVKNLLVGDLSGDVRVRNKLLDNDPMTSSINIINNLLSDSAGITIVEFTYSPTHGLY